MMGNNNKKKKEKKDRPFYLSVNNGQITDRFISVNDGQKDRSFYLWIKSEGQVPSVVDKGQGA